MGIILALAACGRQAPAQTVSTGSTATITTVSTVTTSVRTVVGTTPVGETVTQTATQLTTTPAGPDGIALESGLPLAPTSTTVSGQTIDGIQCNRLVQLAYQVYAHLQISVHGHPRALPGSIGLVNSNAATTGTVTTYNGGLCSYWVHTRAQNGLIAVDSPVPETYTLGDLFDIWGQPLTAARVAQSRGHVTALVNGHRWRRSPRTIPLREHELIQLAVGRPVPRLVPVNWSHTDL